MSQATDSPPLPGSAGLLGLFLVATYTPWITRS